MKIAQCDRCQLYPRKPFIVCAVHPEGPPGNSCLDFRPVMQEQENEPWPPKGWSYYNGELVSALPSYRTRVEQIALLESHPFFTGECPNCGYKFDRGNPPAVHWDYPACQWIDDSV